MTNSFLILGGKFLSRVVKAFRLGHGSTWPGHIALFLNKNFVRDILKKSQTKVIIVSGTNGKTTTTKLIAHILETDGKTVLMNQSGANLLNGIASTILLHATPKGVLKHDYAIFEVDENVLPLVLEEVTPHYIVVLNLFRDQLDRYGEVNTIAHKWRNVLWSGSIPQETTVILNADDPQVAFLGSEIQDQVIYFTIDKKHRRSSSSNKQHAVDSIYCPKCGEKLTFTDITFSHLGSWTCSSCGLKQPKPSMSFWPTSPLPGLYNQYNTNAAVLLTKNLAVKEDSITQALKKFKPAFGRQEELRINGKQVRIFLSKNPTGFNESLRTIKELGAKHILFVLNDGTADGRDVSWIWDTDIEGILDGTEHVSASGTRAFDMAVRLKYAHPVVKHVDTYYPFLDKGIQSALENVSGQETLYILPTYTAMLETRKILTGKKIL